MKLCRTTSAHQIVARNQHPARATQNLDMFQSPLGRFPGFKCFNLFPPPMAYRSHAARPKGSLVRCFSLRKVIMFLHEVRQLLHTLVKDLPSWLKWKTMGARMEQNNTAGHFCVASSIIHFGSFWMANMLGPCPSHIHFVADMAFVGPNRTRKAPPSLCHHQGSAHNDQTAPSKHWSSPCHPDRLSGCPGWKKVTAH